MIQNPILPGFNPDPCICRRGDDFYLAVSTFEWMPGIPVYHSRDLKHWHLLTHCIAGADFNQLINLPSAKGLWAPSLTYSEQEDRFYLVYGVMHSMNARYFDVDNYLITARDITGSWTDPVYLHSAGFDASMLHDEDGRKYVVSLEWETREGYEKPGAICIAEYDAKKQAMVGYPKRIYRGGTDRGCIEAPHLSRRGKYYYLMCAEGGTGYNHCVTMARATNPFGPYEPDPEGALVTSQPKESDERADYDHLKTRYYNPDCVLQKSGHGSYVNLGKDGAYLVHLCARPFLPELRCTLGRETAIQEMIWTKEGWLRMAEGGNLARTSIREAPLPEKACPSLPSFDDFDSDKKELQNFYYSPRILPATFADTKERPGWVRLRGQESLSSLHKVSLLARKLDAFKATVTVKMEFCPEIYQHSAGLALYYDNMNYLCIRKYYSDTLGGAALGILSLENGEKSEHLSARIPAQEGAVYFRLKICERESDFSYSYDGENFTRIGPVFDTSKLSDEYCKYGEFTGTMVGIFVIDGMYRRRSGDFDFFQYERE